MRTLALSALAGALFLTTPAFAAEKAVPADEARAVRTLPTTAKPWKGDFDAMVERRVIRVLAPFSRSLFFNDKGRERGIAADVVREFERYLNRKHAKQLGKRPLTVYLIPTTRDQLLPKLNSGEGDIAIGNLTVTPERLTITDFYVPADLKGNTELVITGPKSPAIATADDLSGKTVHVRKASSYHESLVALNERLKKERKAPVNIVLVPDALEDEDMMEMLNAGILQAIVVDDWKARMWAQVLPKIKVNEGAAVRTGGQVGWAIRKDSPQLRAALDDFYVNFVKKQNVFASKRTEYFKRIKQIADPSGSAEFKRFQDTLALFEKYGTKYGFDPLLLAAQGYQESTLDQKAKSHVGAIGIMQIMPATGAELKVGDITIAENNIHGGAKYMDHLMTKYFPDAKFTNANRSLFAFASYNAGPGNIARMRKEAQKRGLDPDKWFNNVELVTAEKIGMETTTYVRNIYKYYVSYRLLLDMQEAQKKARETVSSGK